MTASIALQEIIVSDTTLRDGEQMPGASLGPDDKLEIARALAEAGVKSIDAGFPACSPSEIDSVRKIAKGVRGPVIMALCRASKPDIDAAARAFEGVSSYHCAAGLFLATSPIHREKKLRKSKDEILGMVRCCVEYARRRFQMVTFSAEDASRTEPDFLCQVYSDAIGAGANVIAFPDTLGVMTPKKTIESVQFLLARVRGIERAKLAVHFHNDLGLATANTLAAIEAGAHIVQCTVNGIGERAGNASLEEVVMALLLNTDQYQRRVSVKPQAITRLSRLVAEKTGIPVAPNKAVVGQNIFATEAGIHQDGLLKDARTYLPFPPEMVGEAGFRLVLGKHSGRSAIQARLRDLGVNLADGQLTEIYEVLQNVGKSAWQDDKAVLLNALQEVQCRENEKLSRG
jgi:2-isopropylmalate synthase